MSEKLILTDRQWREKLTDEQYRICRKKGTEPPFSGSYYHDSGEGIYLCACCGVPLFDSNTKYDSGSGWPSFWQAIDETAVERHTDSSHNMIRTEIVCSHCDAHLGHVFDDGPKPTGERFCVNSVSLKRVNKE